jgi:2-phospho-L-lactate guanylyltransferase
VAIQRSWDDRSVHAIVPMKIIRKSKTRLTSLGPKERARLTVAMLSNVLVALGKSRGIRDVTVVSADMGVSTIAHRYGAKFLWEGKRPELNKALRLAIRRLGHTKTEAVMIVHADLPLLTARNIDRFLIRSKNFEVAIVPCKNGTGTNALLLRPSSAISPVFGKASFKTHLSQAKKGKLRWTSLRISGIQFDLDDPEDLCKFMRYHARGKAFRFLNAREHQAKGI